MLPEIVAHKLLPTSTTLVCSACMLLARCLPRLRKEQEMGKGVHRVQALLFICVVVVLSTVNGDTLTASVAPNVARSTTSFSVQQPQIQSIDQPSVGYTSQQSPSLRSSIPNTYSVHQTLSVAQPSAVYSSSQQNSARAVQQSSPTSFQTSASYSVQQSQSPQAQNNPFFQQQTQSSSDTYSEPQTSVYLQPSHTVQPLSVAQNIQQTSFKSDTRAQVRSDTGSFVAPQTTQRHYSMGASYQVHGAQNKIPIRQRAAYGQTIYHNNRPMQYRRPVLNWMATKRQHVEGPPSGPPGFHLSAPRPPPSAPIHPPKFHSIRSPPSYSGPPRSQHVIYTKPPPEEIYYGPNPPPLDYSPPRHYHPKVIRPIITEPTHFSTPQEPDNHDIMNDLDMYIPDDEPPTPSRISSSSNSPMSSMMMPMMLLGLTLPALGIVFTYLSRRRRRRRDLPSPLSRSEEELDRYMSLLLKALAKAKKSM